MPASASARLPNLGALSLGAPGFRPRADERAEATDDFIVLKPDADCLKPDADGNVAEDPICLIELKANQPKESPDAVYELPSKSGPSHLYLGHSLWKWALLNFQRGDPKLRAPLEPVDWMRLRDRYATYDEAVKIRRAERWLRGHWGPEASAVVTPLHLVPRETDLLFDRSSSEYAEGPVLFLTPAAATALNTDLVDFYADCWSVIAPNLADPQRLGGDLEKHFAHMPILAYAHTDMGRPILSVRGDPRMLLMRRFNKSLAIEVAVRDMAKWIGGVRSQLPDGAPGKTALAFEGNHDPPPLVANGAFGPAMQLQMVRALDILDQWFNTTYALAYLRYAPHTNADRYQPTVGKPIAEEQDAVLRALIRSFSYSLAWAFVRTLGYDSPGEGAPLARGTSPYAAFASAILTPMWELSAHLGRALPKDAREVARIENPYFFSQNRGRSLDQLVLAITDPVANLRNNFHTTFTQTLANRIGVPTTITRRTWCQTLHDKVMWLFAAREGLSDLETVYNGMYKTPNRFGPYPMAASGRDCMNEAATAYRSGLPWEAGPNGRPGYDYVDWGVGGDVPSFTRAIDDARGEHALPLGPLVGPAGRGEKLDWLRNHPDHAIVQRGLFVQPVVDAFGSVITMTMHQLLDWHMCGAKSPYPDLNIDVARQLGGFRDVFAMYDNRLDAQGRYNTADDRFSRAARPTDSFLERAKHAATRAAEIALDLRAFFVAQLEQCAPKDRLKYENERQFWLELDERFLLIGTEDWILEADHGYIIPGGVYNFMSNRKATIDVVIKVVIVRIANRLLGPNADDGAVPGGGIHGDPKLKGLMRLLVGQLAQLACVAAESHARTMRQSAINGEAPWHLDGPDYAPGVREGEPPEAPERRSERLARHEGLLDFLGTMSAAIQAWIDDPNFGDWDTTRHGPDDFGPQYGAPGRAQVRPGEDPDLGPLDANGFPLQAPAPMMGRQGARGEEHFEDDVAELERQPQAPPAPRAPLLPHRQLGGGLLERERMEEMDRAADRGEAREAARRALARGAPEVARQNAMTPGEVRQNRWMRAAQDAAAAVERGLRHRDPYDPYGASAARDHLAADARV